MAAVLAILLFGTISINAQIPPPQFPGQSQPQTGPQLPVIPRPPVLQPAPTPKPPPPPGYQGVGCPNANDPCPMGQYRYDAVTIGTAVYGCFCTCPYTLARDCPAGQYIFNWDTCSCDLTQPPTTAAPTTRAPTTGRPTTQAPTLPRTFPQPGVGVPAPYPGIPGVGVPAPLPGQIPPMGGPGPYPVGPGVPAPPGGWLPQQVPQTTLATTWAPGNAPGTLQTGAPMDELCGPDPFNVLEFRRVGNRITLVMECTPTTTTTTGLSTSSATQPVVT